MNKDRLYASLERKISASVGHRVDLQFADARRINRTTAHFMLEYGDRVPTAEDISQFFVHKFNAKVIPYLTTAKYFDAHKAVTVVAQCLNITRDIEDIKKRRMAPIIQGSTYLDVEMDDIWEVSERNGKRVLTRKNKEDIMALVQARKNSMLSYDARTSFASLATGDILKYLAILEKGDQVRVLVDDKIVDAEVVAASDGEIRVKTKAGQVTVPRQSVVEVVSRSPEKDEQMKERNVEYFTDAFGSEEYAEQMVKYT